MDPVLFQAPTQSATVIGLELPQSVLNQFRGHLGQKPVHTAPAGSVALHLKHLFHCLQGFSPSRLAVGRPALPFEGLTGRPPPIQQGPNGHTQPAGDTAKIPLSQAPMRQPLSDPLAQQHPIRKRIRHAHRGRYFFSRQADLSNRAV